jgi:hypothetical protein
MKAALFLALGLMALAVTGCGRSGEARPYPLSTCIVSDEKLGSMGEPYVFVHEGQEIKLCCKGCLKDFQREPEKYLAKLGPPPPPPPPAGLPAPQ